MPGGDDLIHVIDASLEKSEITSVIAALQPLKEEIKNFSQISIFTKTTTGAADFRAQAQQLQAALDRIKAIELELDKIRSGNATKQHARTDQEIADTQRKAEATRSRVRDIRSEEDAYKRLTNEYSKAAAEAKKLAAQYGVHSEQAKVATKSAKELGEQISAINKATGNSAPNTGVGRYTEGIREFAKELLHVLAPMYLFHKAVEYLSESVNEFKKAEDSAAQLKNILNNLHRDRDLEELNQEAKHLSETLGTITPHQIQETFKQLYAYGKLSKSQIMDLMPVLIDFAAKQRIDLPEAADILTKSFQGRTSAALREMGINFKGATTTAERFGIVMTELEPRVRGSAKRFGEEVTGQLKKIEVVQEELKVKIGSEWAPILNTVWTTILKIGSQIPAFFSAIADGAKEAWFEVKSLFGNSKDLADFHAAEKLKDTIEFHNKQYDAAEKAAEEFRQEKSRLTLDDLRKELAAHKLIAQASREKYEAVQKLGTLNSYEGEKVRQQALKDALIVRQLTRMIDSKKDTSPVFNGANDDETNPTAEEIKREIEAQAKLYALRLQAAIDYQKILSEEKENTIASRTAAYKKLIDLERQQVEGERDLKLKNTKLTEGERELIIYEAEEKMMKYRVENIKILSDIRYAAMNDDKVLMAQNNKELEDLAAAHYKAIDDLRAAALVRSKAYIEDARSIELLANEKAFGGSTDPAIKKKYQDNVDRINNAADLANLKDERSNTISQLPTASADKRVSLEARISQLNLEIYKKEHADKKRMDEQAYAEKQKLSGLEIKAAEEVGHAVESFVTGAYERQINAIQKQIDKNNILKEKETQSIASSTLSLQEKAEAQILLDAKVNASNEALHRRQRDLKIKEAQFDRAASILQITEQAAIAAIAALKIPIYGEAEAIAIGVIAAAQIASILAKPIPTYWTGVVSKPVDGPMIVGEKGSERITEPSGKTYMTPGVPTLMYGKKGTRITPAHEVNQEMLSGIMRAQIHEMKQDRTEELLTTLIEIGQNQTSAMKKKQVIHNHIHWNPGFNDHINSAVRN